MSSQSVAYARLLSAATGVAALLLAGPMAAAPKPEPLIDRSHSETSVVTVKAVDATARKLTIANDKGETQTLDVPSEYKRLAAVKPGDRIKATYKVETLVSLVAPGAKTPKDEAATVGARAVTGTPAAAAAGHVTVTGAVLAIDMKRHMLKIVSPQGGEVHWVEVTHEDGRKAMEKLKVGDKITASVTAALLLEVQPA
jgi:hypothetical protein